MLYSFDTLTPFKGFLCDDDVSGSVGRHFGEALIKILSMNKREQVNYHLILYSSIVLTYHLFIFHYLFI